MSKSINFDKEIEIRNLVDTMEIAAINLRRQLGYSDDELAITFEDLFRKIDDINHLTVKKYEEPLRSMSAEIDDGYLIILGGETDEKTCKEQLLHELAHILFDDSLPQYDGGPIEFSELRADIFTRCFLMPKAQFLEAFISNSNSDEVVNINGIATVFNVNDYLVMERGEELLGWK